MGSFILFALLLFCIWNKVPYGIIRDEFQNLKAKKNSSLFKKITAEQVDAAKRALEKPMAEEASTLSRKVFNLDIAKLWCGRQVPFVVITLTKTSSTP